MYACHISTTTHTPYLIRMRAHRSQYRQFTKQNMFEFDDVFINHLYLIKIIYIK